MMKKWLFSNNGEISGPLGLVAAKDFVINNPDLYAWHPSYTHWMPVTCIEEFNTIIKVPNPPSVIPKELIEQFIVKERSMIAKLDELEKRLDLTNASLSELDQEIELNKRLTQNCNDEIRTTINSIEHHYDLLRQNLVEFKRSEVATKSEFSEIIAEFKERAVIKADSTGDQQINASSSGTSTAPNLVEEQIIVEPIELITEEKNATKPEFEPASAVGAQTDVKSDIKHPDITAIENTAETQNIVESEDASVADIPTSSKVQHIQSSDSDEILAVKKQPSSQNSSGELDYILKGADKDDSLIGEPVLGAEDKSQKSHHRRGRRIRS